MTKTTTTAKPLTANMIAALNVLFASGWNNRKVNGNLIEALKNRKLILHWVGEPDAEGNVDFSYSLTRAGLAAIGRGV